MFITVPILYLFLFLVCFLRPIVDQVKNLKLNENEFTVIRGATGISVAKVLAPEVPTPFFSIFFRIYPDLGRPQIGRYKFENHHFLEALSDISQGKVVPEKITIPEGISMKEMLVKIDSHSSITDKNYDIQELLKGWPGKTMEGGFLAETYLWSGERSKKSLLEEAHESLKKVLEGEWEQRAPDLPFSSPYEALILASIVEKETALGIERPRIAGVFIKRLILKMRLQTDPTVIYGLGEKYKGNITRKHLREATEYNTYVIPRLPPTPIAIVGLSALNAVMHPRITGELYFVAKGDGSHAFSRTLKEHNKNVRKYQLGK